MVSINNNLAYVPDILSIYTTSDRTEFHCICAACNKNTVTGASIEIIKKNRDIAYDSYLKSIEDISTSEIRLGLAYNEIIRIQEKINELEVTNPTK